MDIENSISPRVTLNDSGRKSIEAEDKTEGNLLELCIIPITLEKTNMSVLKIGDRVNIEFDILAKYTEKLLSK